MFDQPHDHTGWQREARRRALRPLHSGDVEALEALVKHLNEQIEQIRVELDDLQRQWNDFSQPHTGPDDPDIPF